MAQYTTVCPTGGNKMQLYDPLVEKLNFVLGETQYSARTDLQNKQPHLCEKSQCGDRLWIFYWMV